MSVKCVECSFQSIYIEIKIEFKSRLKDEILCVRAFSKLSNEFCVKKSVRVSIKIKIHNNPRTRAHPHNSHGICTWMRSLHEQNTENIFSEKRQHPIQPLQY